MPEYRKNDSLIEARKKAGLTRREAAEAIGISYPRYSNYENENLYPTRETQERICDFFCCKGISIEEDEVFPEELKDIAKKYYIPKKERISQGIVHLPPSSIRYLSDHNPVDMPPYYGIEREVIQKELSERVREALASLPPREEKVLRMHYGMGEKYGHDYTLKETGRSFGVKKERIRQIEAEALSRLRDSGRTDELKIFWED